MKKILENSSIKIRRSRERGHAKHGWLESYHTFSFAGYQDPNYMGFRVLRVINEDRVEPGMGFGAHPHDNMEIFSYVIEGALTHQDSMGHKFTIGAGDVQKITAGTRIVHSEFNASTKEIVHFLQIWILPIQRGLEPSYQEYSGLKNKQSVTLIGSPEGGENVIKFHQDVYIYKGHLKQNETFTHELKPTRGVWFQVIQGKLNVNNEPLSTGDGAAIENVSQIKIFPEQECEFLLMDFA